MHANGSERSDTAACILLPAFVERKASCLLAGMRRVHRYAPGSPLFNGLSLSGAPVPLPPLPYSVDVWYDAPSQGPSVIAAPFLSTVSLPVLSAIAGAHLPLVHVMAAGLPLKTLVDYGASHDFISDSVVRQLGLQLRDSAWSHVTLADGNKQRILGEVFLRVTLGSLRLTLQPYVLSGLTDAASLILGSSSLARHSATLDYGRRALFLHDGARRCKVSLLDAAPKGDTAAAPAANFAVAAMCQRAAPKPIGHKAAMRLLRKGAHAVLVRPKQVTSYKLRTSAGESVKAGGAMDSCSDFLRCRGRSSSPSLVHPFEYGAPERNVPRLPDL